MSAFVALLCFGFVAVAATISPADDPSLPDLVSDPVENPVFEVQTVSGQNRRLLRFDGFVHNAGSHPLQVEGTRSPSDPAGAMTTIRQTGHGIARPGSTMKFEATDGHYHWHLGRATGYSLVDPDGALVAPSAKVGFCLLDSFRVEGSAPQIPWNDNHQCEAPWSYADGRYGYGEDATSVTMTLSPGWRDFYGWDVWLQWVDISGVQPGRYKLRSIADPDDLIAETDENNPPADVPVVLGGYTADPVAVPNAARAASTTFDLAATKIENPAAPVGDVEYRLLSAPTNGTVDRPVGQWFSGSNVTFTPDATTRSTGAAQLTFAAREAGAEFPTAPATAKASISLTAKVPVSIAGAPAQVFAGTSVALAAAGTGPMAWSTDLGTIAPDGTFTAPDADGGLATVTVTDADGQTDSVTIRIAPKPSVVPIPGGDPALLTPASPATNMKQVAPRGSSATQTGKGPVPTFDRLTAKLSGPYVTISLRPGRSGKLRLSLVRSDRWLKSCSATARVKVPVTCRLVVKGSTRNLRVVATFRATGRKPMVKRLAVEGSRQALRR